MVAPIAEDSGHTLAGQVANNAITEPVPCEDEPRPISVKQVPTFSDSELVIGLVGAVGTDLSLVHGAIHERLKNLTYSCQHIKVSKDVIPKIVDLPGDFQQLNEYNRVGTLMDLGDEARRRTKNHGVLALGVASVIAMQRDRTLDLN